MGDWFYRVGLDLYRFAPFLDWQIYWYKSIWDNNPEDMDMKAQSDDSTMQMQTLSEATTKAAEKGYNETFKVVGKGLTTEAEEKFWSPEEVKIPNFFRFEGYSDPMDNVILYLVETNDGVKGTLIDAYGAYADAKLSKFIKEVEDIQQKIIKK